MGGTGLEPVTPSLSIRPLAYRLVPPVSVCFRQSRLFTEVAADFEPVDDKRWHPTYREFRHCTGTASVSGTENTRRQQPQPPAVSENREVQSVLPRSQVRSLPGPLQKVLLIAGWRFGRRNDRCRGSGKGCD